MKFPNIKLPVIGVKTDPLDTLLYGLGLRLAWLSRQHDGKFVKATQGKDITLLFKSDGMARYYRFQDGSFGQASGEPKQADLTISFATSVLGVKLIAKGDLASVMSAIQDGDVSVTGDYKLLMWFVGLAKHATTVPEEYQPYVDKAKPYLKKVRGLLKK